MANIEFEDAGDSGNRPHIVVIQAMAGVDLQPQTGAQGHGLVDAVQLDGTAVGIAGLGIAAGVNLDHGDADGQFRLPHAIDLDEDGQVYVADRENKRLQIFEPDGTHVQTISHPGIGKPFGLCVTPEAIYVADCGFPEDQRAGIAIVDRRTQAVRRVASYGAGDGQLLAPHDLVVGAGGDIFVADAVLGLRRFDAPSGVL